MKTTLFTKELNFFLGVKRKAENAMPTVYDGTASQVPSQPMTNKILNRKEPGGSGVKR